jgi:hypothetical protein
MPTRESCKQEIERLHSFFVDWYDGILDEDEFARFADALDDDFEMVVPTGTVLDRRGVLGMVRDGYGNTAHEGFDIEIRNVELVRDLDEAALVRYEEWQLTGEEGDERDEDGRVSAVLLRETDDAPGGLSWDYLHETALEEG